MSVQRIWVGDLHDSPLLLTAAYPFVRQRTRLGPGWTVLQAKLAALLGHTMTFAGSTLLLDEQVRTSIYPALEVFFEEGILVPDLRREAQSFEHLAHLRKKNQTATLEHARRLDRTVRQAITFEPVAVSTDFQLQLSVFLESKARKLVGADSWAALDLATKLRARADPILLIEAKQLGSSLTFAPEYKKMCDFLYCSTGAKVVGADILLDRAFHREYAYWNWMASPSPAIEREVFALEALLDVYGCNLSQLEHLTTRSILKLRNDERIKHAVTQLRDLAHVSDAAGIGRDVEEVRREISAAVHSAVKKQDLSVRFGNPGVDLALELVEHGGLMKKFASMLWSFATSNRYTGKTVRSMTPLPVFVSLVRDQIQRDAAKQVASK